MRLAGELLGDGVLAEPVSEIVDQGAKEAYVVSGSEDPRPVEVLERSPPSFVSLYARSSFPSCSYGPASFGHASVHVEASAVWMAQRSSLLSRMAVMVSEQAAPAGASLDQRAIPSA